MDEFTGEALLWFADDEDSATTARWADYWRASDEAAAARRRFHQHYPSRNWGVNRWQSLDAVADLRWARALVRQALRALGQRVEPVEGGARSSTCIIRGRRLADCRNFTAGV